jgi:hypothetical protein
MSAVGPTIALQPRRLMISPGAVGCKRLLGSLRDSVKNGLREATMVGVGCVEVDFRLERRPLST